MALISRVAMRGEIREVQVARQSSIIVSLCSANDTLLFGKATEEKTATLKQL